MECYSKVKKFFLSISSFLYAEKVNQKRKKNSNFFVCVKKKKGREVGKKPSCERFSSRLDIVIQTMVTFVSFA